MYHAMEAMVIQKMQELANMQEEATANKTDTVSLCIFLSSVLEAFGESNCFKFEIFGTRVKMVKIGETSTNSVKKQYKNAAQNKIILRKSLIFSFSIFLPYVFVRSLLQFFFFSCFFPFISSRLLLFSSYKKIKICANS